MWQSRAWFLTNQDHTVPIRQLKQLHDKPSSQRFVSSLALWRGHAVAQLVEAISRKVAVSITDDVIGIFH
jgi:hypothetical protein